MSTSNAPPAGGGGLSPTATKRLRQEIRQSQEQPSTILLHLGLVNDAELNHWEAVMKGVPGSAYEAGMWKLDIRVPDNYPNAPPEIVFVTRCCHPNVEWQTGKICLDLFNKGWTPAYTLTSALDAVHHLLSYPEPDQPFNVDIANLYREGDLVGAESLIRFYCREYRWEGR